MIAISIPGFRDLQLNHLVLDYNGTLSVDGELLPGVADRLNSLSMDVKIHVVTADTFGTAADRLERLPVTLKVIAGERQADAKLDFIESLGASGVAAIGNGRNDRKMVKTAALGIALIQREGGAPETFIDADLVCLDIVDALDLFTHPKRLVASLRS